VLIETKWSREDESSTLGLLGRSRQVADALGVRLVALLVGSQREGREEQVSKMGADEVVLAEGATAQTYYNPDSYATVVAEALKQLKPALFVMNYDYVGMEVGPSVAARLDAVLVSNCIDFEVRGDQLQATRPQHYGKIQTKLAVRLEPGVPVVLTIQKGALPSAKLPPSAANISRLSLPGPGASRIKVIGRTLRPTDGTDISQAKVVVSGGLGFKEPGDLRLLKDLADALGASVGCSRPIVDKGWLSASHQVGLSGVTVRPKVYFAIGISGASQHQSGMKDSEIVVAINRDPNAPIFQLADYGIVGDLFEIVPALITQAKNMKSN
jgi:electron transfer flavoprotein alpha subunit